MTQQLTSDWRLDLPQDEQWELRGNLRNLLMLSYWHSLNAYCASCSTLTVCHLRVMRLSNGMEVGDLACDRCRNAFGDEPHGKLIFAARHGAISEALQRGEALDEQTHQARAQKTPTERLVDKITAAERAQVVYLRRHTAGCPTAEKAAPTVSEPSTLRALMAQLKRWLA